MQTYRRTYGFTIVELLIVIVVIAILAAITIVSYNGITKSAIESSMKSDLQGVNTLAQVDYTATGAFPVSAQGANGGSGFKVSGGNQLAYKLISGGFCATITNPRVSTSYFYSTSVGSIQEGACALTVATFAGSGTTGIVNGSALAAQFGYPTGIAVDSSGNVFVAEANNHLIRKITSSGTVSTFAGSGTAGDANGTGAAAQFRQPFSLAVDGADNLYVAERAGCRIRKITPAAVVTTIAGDAANCGAMNGTGTDARFNWPWGIGVDSSGSNIYVGDTDNCVVRKITSGGVVTTIGAFGSCSYADGSSAAARFSYPSGITVDPSGNVFVADSGNNRIRKITPAGDVSPVAGSGTAGDTDGTGAAAQLRYPTGITRVSNGDLYVMDYDSQRIRKVTQGGVVTTITQGGSGYAEGDPAGAKFNDAYHLFAAPNGALYVADPGNYRIRLIQ